MSCVAVGKAASQLPRSAREGMAGMNTGRHVERERERELFFFLFGTERERTAGKKSQPKPSCHVIEGWGKGMCFLFLPSSLLF